MKFDALALLLALAALLWLLWLTLEHQTFKVKVIQAINSTAQLAVQGDLDISHK
jgi:hypothetical protein